MNFERNRQSIQFQSILQFLKPQLSSTRAQSRYIRGSKPDLSCESRGVFGFRFENNGDCQANVGRLIQRQRDRMKFTSMFELNGNVNAAVSSCVHLSVHVDPRGGGKVSPASSCGPRFARFECSLPRRPLHSVALFREAPLCPASSCFNRVHRVYCFFKVTRFPSQKRGGGGGGGNSFHQV